MSKINKAREAWRAAYKTYGKGSKEEKAAYQKYMEARQGLSSGIKAGRK